MYVCSDCGRFLVRQGCLSGCKGPRLDTGEPLSNNTEISIVSSREQTIVHLGTQTLLYFPLSKQQARVLGTSIVNPGIRIRIQNTGV